MIDEIKSFEERKKELVKLGKEKGLLLMNNWLMH